MKESGRSGAEFAEKVKTERRDVGGAFKG